MRQVHVITPGDHFSPSTGSAIPTVVDGLCRFRPDGVPRPAVAVARGTYPDRYDSADIIEYDEAAPLRLPRGLSERYVDGALGLAGLPRWPSRRKLAPTVGAQDAWEPSVVMAHNAPQLVPLIDHARHVPVLYAHNQLLRTYGKAEVRRVIGRASAIICVSEFLANWTLEHLPRDLHERMRVVRNGVDFESFRRATPLVRTGPLKVLFLGRMVPSKGADVLLEAVRELDRPDIHLTIVGSSGFSAHDAPTKFEQELRESAHELGDRAVLLPFVPRSEVASILRTADVFVVPSRLPDAFALTALEGMAAGAAVIGADIGGIPESLKGAGILVPPDNSAALAEAIEALADDEPLLRSTAEACEEFARTHDWAWASSRFHDVMREFDSERPLD